MSEFFKEDPGYLNEQAFRNESTQNETIWGMLKELYDEAPWNRKLCDSFKNYIRVKGKLSPKQRPIVTQMYLDHCTRSEKFTERQKDARKLLYRMREVKFGGVWGNSFVNDLYQKDNRPYTDRQLETLDKLAHKFRGQLTKIPVVTDDMFDGWNVNWNKFQQARADAAWQDKQKQKQSSGNA